MKREDLSSDVLGGNKVRSLEFLLGGVVEGDTVLTLGGEGSTHVLATAVHAARLGAQDDRRSLAPRHALRRARGGGARRRSAPEVVTASNFV